MIGKLPIIDRELLASGVFLRSEFQARQAGENGFIACDETFAIYGRDVYMWKTYLNQCQEGDWVKFNIHISDKGLPQVCWLEAQGGAMGRKRPMDAGFSGAKRPAWGQAPTVWG